MKFKIISLLFPALFLAMSMLLMHCEKEKPSKVEENGLTKDINDLVPSTILDEMKRLGMSINGGENPPNIENTFRASRFVLRSSNRSGDFVGQTFADYEVKFYAQNNKDLTIKIDYLNGPESGMGIGSFIVGDDCKFSVFSQIDAVNSGTKAKLVHVISGYLREEGIYDLVFSNFMVDDFGDPKRVWIEKGQGRVIYDEDGFSEVVGKNPAWYERLPDCPCTYDEAKRLSQNSNGCYGGKWEVCDNASQVFHFGASYEVRWSPSIANRAGQQCTYDRKGLLITSGIAAGSPDKISPQSCGYGDWLNNIGVQLFCSRSEHCKQDVVPWTERPCTEYLNNWPANKGRSCNTQNAVSDIQHIRKLVGNMTCKEITQIFTVSSSSNVVPEKLKDYLSGKTPSAYKTDVEVLQDLKVWQFRESCPATPTTSFCQVLGKAIKNMGG